MTAGRSGLDVRSLDIDDYVTQKALDGLFLMVADAERRIREDPVARTTRLLQLVFGRQLPPRPPRDGLR